MGRDQRPRLMFSGRLSGMSCKRMSLSLWMSRITPMGDRSSHRSTAILLNEMRSAARRP
jgi:hypothetical protein